MSEITNIFTDAEIEELNRLFSKMDEACSKRICDCATCPLISILHVGELDCYISKLYYYVSIEHRRIQREKEALE